MQHVAFDDFDVLSDRRVIFARRAPALAFTPRFIVYTLSVLLTAALLLTVLAYPPAIDLAAVPLALFGGFTVLGTRDLIQTPHAVLRNYPISAHLRFLLEQNTTRDASIFLRRREGRPAVQPGQAGGGLSAGQDGAGQASVRDAVRRLCARIGLIWDEATLQEYLKSPRAKVPGTKMLFPGLKRAVNAIPN
jgi:hypothetical protein